MLTMKRFLIGLLALFCAVGPAPAQTLSGARSIPLLSANRCSTVLISLTFTSNVYCASGAKYGSPTAIPGWSFTRASVGWAKDSQGNDVQFASGVPRITDLGLLVEESRTNFLLNSTAPVTQTTGSLATGTYTVWLVGSGSAAVTAGSGTATGLGTATSAAPVTFTVTVAGTFTVTNTGSVTFFQLENGGAPTSRIVTAGATATRAADVPTIGSLILPAAYTWIAKGLVSAQTGGTFPTIVSSTGNAGLLVTASTGAIGANMGGGGFNSGSGGTASVGQKAMWAFRALTNDANLAGNGSLGTHSTSFTPQTGSVTLYLGSNSGSAAFWNGYFQSFAIPPTAYSDAQLLGATQ